VGNAPNCRASQIINRSTLRSYTSWESAPLEELAESLGHGAERELLLGQAIRTTEVAHQDDAGAVIESVVDGGQCGLNALRVADLTLIKGDVEINPRTKRSESIIQISKV
jgi:hypothetical protein